MKHEIQLHPFLELLPCPFCGGDVEHPKLATDSVFRFEITCGECKLTMHENVGEDRDENAHDYARFKLVGRWCARPAVPGAEPVKFKVKEILPA